MPPRAKRPETRPRFARWEARIAPELKDLFQKAADIEGRTLTDFIIGCVAQEAQRIVQQDDLIRLGERDRQVFAAPFVILDPGPVVVKGYYTLSMTGIDAGTLPVEFSQYLPKYSILPATLLGRLAVDVSCRNRGLGRLLMINALHRSLRAEIAWIALVVDAAGDDARAFYEHLVLWTFPTSR